MSNRNRIAAFIIRFPGRDDDEISAALGIEPRQQVNRTCRALAQTGQIERRPNGSGKIGNFPKMARTTNPQIQPIQMVNDKAAPADLATNDWFWEGNVVDVLVQALSDHGCSIISVADTHSKQQGIDIHAMLGSQGLLIEVKGYPSHSYRDPRRASETKRTNPTVQAQHWYAQALLKALRLRFAQPEAKIAIGLPDMPRYRALFAETGCALEELGVGVLFVDEQGSVDAHYITLNC